MRGASDLLIAGVAGLGIGIGLAVGAVVVRALARGLREPPNGGQP